MKTNKKFPFKIEISNAIDDILLNNTKVSTPDSTMMTGIQNFGARTGYITTKQMAQVGRCSKLYSQNGQYENHNWWNK